MRVFVSSTQEDLAKHRAAVVELCDLLGHEVVHMEDPGQFPPTRRNPEEVCRAKVEPCDLVIVLVAHRYGSPVPGREISYTELEYETALGLPHVEIQAWLMDPDHPWPPNRVDTGASQERLEKFRHRLSGHTTGFFTTPDHLRRQVGAALKAVTGTRTGRADRGSHGSNLAPMAPAPVAYPDYIGSMEFTGRAKELAWLAAWADSDDPVAVIDAIGGSGKSALTWHWWTQEAAPLPDQAGRFWWSFYERDQTVHAFLKTFAEYAGLSIQGDRDPAQAVLLELSARPYLVVLDGVERLLDYYADLGGSARSDDPEASAVESARRYSDPRAHRFFSQLLGVRGSKLLMSTRLVPDAFLTAGTRLRPGARLFELRGLASEDLARLLTALGITRSERALDFFAQLDNHPLLVKVVVGMVRDRRAAPGNFEAWLADPRAGGSFNFATLDLAERGRHILALALAGIGDLDLLLLQRLSVPYGASEWDFVRHINPFVEGALGEIAWETMAPWLAKHVSARRDEQRRGEVLRPEDLAAEEALVVSLQRLEDLGLLWWDRELNLYDMHPVVRGHVRSTLDEDVRRTTHELVIDHFGHRPRGEGEGAGGRHLETWVRYHEALVAAGRWRAVADQWDDRSRGRELLWTRGEHALAIALLEPAVEAVRSEETNTSLLADLAFARGQVGRLDEALADELVLMEEGCRMRASVSVVQVALHNVAISAERCGRRRWTSEYQRLDGMLDAMVGLDSSRARQALRRAVKANDERRYDEALDATAVVAAGPTNPHSGTWKISLETLRRRALLGLLRFSEVERPDPLNPPCDTNWTGSLQWATYAWTYAVATEDPALALEAAREIDTLRQVGGQESSRAQEARALAWAGDLDGARSLLDEHVLPVLARLHPYERPYQHVARTFHLLADAAGAAEHAHEALRCALGVEEGDEGVDVLFRVTDLFADLGLGKLPTLDRRPATPAPHLEVIEQYVEAVREGSVRRE